MTVQRTVTFFAALDMRGKFHARRIVTGEAQCGVGAILDEQCSIVVEVDDLNRRVHPLVCRRCARSAA